MIDNIVVGMMTIVMVVTISLVLVTQTMTTLMRRFIMTTMSSTSMGQRRKHAR